MEEIDKNSLGARIQSIRLSYGDNMREFGERIARKIKESNDNEDSNVSVPSDSIVSRWEKGVSVPSSERIKAIAELGDISVDELLYGSFLEYAFQLLEQTIDKSGAEKYVSIENKKKILEDAKFFHDKGIIVIGKENLIKFFEMRIEEFLIPDIYHSKLEQQHDEQVSDYIDTRIKNKKTFNREVLKSITIGSKSCKKSIEAFNNMEKALNEGYFLYLNISDIVAIYHFNLLNKKQIKDLESLYTFFVENYNRLRRASNSEIEKSESYATYLDNNVTIWTEHEKNLINDMEYYKKYYNS